MFFDEKKEFFFQKMGRSECRKRQNAHLSLFRIDFDAIKTIVLLDLNDDLLAFAGRLVHSNDSVQSPIGDVNDIFKDDKREGMADEEGANCLDICSV